jgi:uncharacterized membrane protein
MKPNAFEMFLIVAVAIAAIEAYFIGDFEWLLGAAIGAVIGGTVVAYRRFKKMD